MAETVSQNSQRGPEDLLHEEIGPVGRALAARYFTPVRFPQESVETLQSLHAQGFVVHVMRTSAWLNFLFLAWALVRRGLPPLRAIANLRKWVSRPWTKAARQGPMAVRFAYARRKKGSALVFLRHSAFGAAKGRESKEDPFPFLVAMARRKEGNVFLVPELFVWEKIRQRLRRPSLQDYLFGTPESPAFLYTLIAFWRNYHRAQFRVGEAINLKQFIEQHPHDSDEVLARKVRSSLYVHLAQETRAVFGPPSKPTERLIEETLRDRVLRKALEEISHETGRTLDSLYKESRKNLRQIAARLTPTMVALASPILNWVFNRIYDGIEVDEAGLDRAMKAATRMPIVLVPSHKSHVDYLLLSYIFWERGYQVPLVAAGANLSFWPLGAFLRRCGAFFLRRSFKGDKVYAATFRAYIKKLVFDGVHQEFFPEGGRSRTGKLLEAKLGLITWEIDALLEGARDDLAFLPVAIDYERVVESASYSRELAGGEKKPEDIKALLSTPKVLSKRYGRIYLTFDEPVLVSEVLQARGLSSKEDVTEEQKRRLVRAVGNRIMYGISRVSTVTPHALVAAVLLAHRRRGISAKEISERIGLLRSVATDEKVPISKTLVGVPSDPTVFGSVKDAMSAFGSDGIVRLLEARGEVIYQVDEQRRIDLLFPKNTLMNMVASRSLVATALLSLRGQTEYAVLLRRALLLSRLFKFEFIYRTGLSFDAIFDGVLERLVTMGLIVREETRVTVAPEAFARPQLEFFSDLLRDYLESYLLAVQTVKEVASGSVSDGKAFVKAGLENGRAQFLAGKIETAESLTRTNFENALNYLVDQNFLRREEKKLSLGTRTPEEREQLLELISSALLKTPT